MSKTKHIKVRMNQRAIEQNIIDLVVKFSAIQTIGSIEKYFLTKKNIDKTLRLLDRLRSRLIHAKDKGGIVLVKDSNGTEITTYRLPRNIKKHKIKKSAPNFMSMH